MKVFDASSPTITNNTITGHISLALSQHLIPPSETSLISYNIIHGDINIHGGSPTINDNIISGAEDFAIGVNSEIPDYVNAQISNNIITDCHNGISVSHGSATIYGNLISGVNEGVNLGEFAKAKITGNKIANNNAGIYGSADNLTIEGNLIINNTKGLYVTSQTIIKNNTLANNTIAIQSPSALSTIFFNNIDDNMQNSIYLSFSSNVNASYNWWGTIDQQAINQTIHDFQE